MACPMVLLVIVIRSLILCMYGKVAFTFATQNKGWKINT